MQLSREELSKLDLIIERYVDDTTSKEAVAIETYLNKIDSLERELFVNVNIKMYKSDKIKMYNYSKLT